MDVSKVLVDLAACLCQKAGGSLCFCGVLPGQTVVDMSGTECDPAGQGWVRLINAYPSERVGVPSQTVNNLGLALGFGVEVGIMRHFPISSEPLTDEEILDASLTQIGDMEVIRSAILCCDSLNPKDFILNTYTPIGPAGGLVGGQWTISVSLL
jgi:hypothetical protein